MSSSGWIMIAVDAAARWSRVKTSEVAKPIASATFPDIRNSTNTQANMPTPGDREAKNIVIVTATISNRQSRLAISASKSKRRMATIAARIAGVTMPSWSGSASHRTSGTTTMSTNRNRS
ncbi:MAG TPA: hypothetical protein VM900_12740 [Sphingomonas sp.]|nr:hypothetical protein [Sphingomonas sp.]